MNDQERKLRQKLEQRMAEDALRQLKIDEGLIDFSSNDYLGLSQVREIHAFSPPYEKKTGSTGSRLLTGNTAFAEEVERSVAAYHNAESALLFNSGYAANTGLLSAIPGRNDTIIYDELSHASIRDGIRLSYASSFSFKHNDINDLEKKLGNSKGQVYVIIESLYSMDGDLAPLREIAACCERSGAALIVDEAHAAGVFGEKGEGLVSREGLEISVFARVITYGKAFGSHGAAVLGSAVLRQYLINFSRPFIFTTALPYHSVKAVQQAYLYLSKHPDVMSRLHENIRLFRHEMKGMKTYPGPVQRVVIPGNTKVKKVSGQIREKGFLVYPVLSPTVPKGKERLRISLHAFNRSEDIIELCNLLKAY